MLEPAIISYERVPNHLVGPTSNHFVLPQKKILVAALAGFKLISFPPLTNKKTLDSQVLHLIGANEPNTELQKKLLQSLIPPPLTILQRFLKSHLKGLLSDPTSITYGGRHLPPDVLKIWMVLATEWKNGILYDRVVGLLQNVSWGGTVQGFNSTGHFPISMIAAYLSDDWLSDVHMQQFTELLERHLLSDSRHFDNYPDHPYLECIGRDLASGCRKCIVGMRNIGADHWIAFVIDSCSASIAIGDSFKKLYPSSVNTAS
ncbi:hypothetical protein F5888DRAFT_1806075 [Russula emetica]|nr:hypothetical protein F5888DRAFT_1806075 [Russula emetica]